jgi:hypothetical protein
MRLFQVQEWPSRKRPGGVLTLDLTIGAYALILRVYTPIYCYGWRVRTGASRLAAEHSTFFRDLAMTG